MIRHVGDVSPNTLPPVQATVTMVAPMNRLAHQARLPQHTLIKWLPWILVLLMLMVELGYSLFALAVPDSSRDVLMARGICQGTRFPAEGPLLAGRFHLGPIWYYLLAPAACGNTGFLGAALFTGLLSGLKYPLAFVLGRQYGGALFGLALAVGLLIWSWPTTLLIFTHTSALLTVLMVLLWALWRYWCTGRWGFGLALAAACALAVNLHPSAYAFSLLLPIAVWRHRHRSRTRPQAVMMVLVFCLPLLPPAWVLLNASGGTSGATGLNGLLAVFDPGRLILLPDILWRLLSAPLTAAPQGFAQPWLAPLMLVLAAGFTLPGLAGLVTGRQGPATKPVAILLLGLVSVAISIVLLRDFFPYYMLLPLVPALVLLLASGWQRLAAAAAYPALAIIATGLMVTHGVMLSASADKNYQVPVAALYDLPVASGLQRIPATHWFNARELASNQDFCNRAGFLHPHGLLRTRLNDSLSLPVQGCSTTGNSPLAAGRIGLPVRLLDQLGVECRGGASDLGVLSVAEHYSDDTSLNLAETYPSHQVANEPATRVFRPRIGDGQALLVGHLYYFNPWQVEVTTASGRTATAWPISQYGQIYTCEDCGVEGGSWRVRVTAPGNDPLDVVTFDLHQACQRL